MCVARKLVTCVPFNLLVVGTVHGLAGNLPVSGARLFTEHNSVMNVFGWVMSCY